MVVARKLSSVFGCTFQYPVLKPRIFLLDHPEILLAALLIVATKLCFPFHQTSHSLLDVDSGSVTRFDWSQWNLRIAGPFAESKASQEGPNYDHVKTEHVVAMTDDELDAYLSHVASFVDNPSESARLFKLGDN